MIADCRELTIPDISEGEAGDEAQEILLGARELLGLEITGDYEDDSEKMLEVDLEFDSGMLDSVRFVLGPCEEGAFETLGDAAIYDSFLEAEGDPGRPESLRDVWELIKTLRG